MPVIAIDGPVGSGKSTAARELARELGFIYLNTGAMYRAVAIAARAEGLKSENHGFEQRLAGLLAAISISFENGRALLNGVDVSARLGDPEISDLASRLSVLAPVRARMQELQREMGASGAIVMEGRDIGTAVFPDAEFKFYLEAEPGVRAARRFAELSAKGIATTYSKVFDELLERDRRDSGRALAPLRRADDAVIIDTNALGVAEVVNLMKNKIEELWRGARRA